MNVGVGESVISECFLPSFLPSLSVSPVVLHPYPFSSNWLWGGGNQEWPFLFPLPSLPPSFPPCSSSPYLPHFLPLPILLLSPFIPLLFSIHSLPLLPLSSSLRRGWSRSHPLGTEWPEWRQLSLPAFLPGLTLLFLPQVYQWFFCFVPLVHTYLLFLWTEEEIKFLSLIAVPLAPLSALEKKQVYSSSTLYKNNYIKLLMFLAVLSPRLPK